MTPRQILLDSKKALGAAAVMVTSAVGFGLVDSATAGIATGVIGVATVGVVYLLKNEKPPAEEQKG